MGVHLHVGVGQHKLADDAVVGEAIHAVADGEHKDGRRGVEAVAGGQQAGSRLADIEDAVFHHLLGVVHVAHRALLAGRVDAEDGAR